MPVVTEDKYNIAVEIERIAKAYGVPRMELMDLVRLGFESGQRDGLTFYANNLINSGGKIAEA